jgi:hypothetical protein
MKLKLLFALLLTAVLAAPVAYGFVEARFSHDHWADQGGGPPRGYDRWADEGKGPTRREGGGVVHGVPGPVAGAGVPLLVVTCGAYWLVRRYRRKTA